MGGKMKSIGSCLSVYRIRNRHTRRENRWPVITVVMTFILIFSMMSIVLEMTVTEVQASDSEDDPFGFSDDFNDYGAYDWDNFNAQVMPPNNPPPQGSDGTPYLGVGQNGNLGRARMKTGITGRSDILISYDTWTKQQRGESYFVFYSLQNIRNGGYAFKLSAVNNQFSEFVHIDRGTGLFIPIGAQVNQTQLDPDTKYLLKVVETGQRFYAFIDGDLAATAEHNDYITYFSSFAPNDVWSVSPYTFGVIDNHVVFINMIAAIGVYNIDFFFNTLFGAGV